MDAAPRFGVTTGISASDRATTIRMLADEDTRPDDLRRPGHVFPLRAVPGGVLRRVGQTEASVDMARLAGLPPVGVICEILNADGTMARRPELEVFAREHGLRFITVAQLVAYRLAKERLVRRVATVQLPTPFGEFRLIGYDNTLDNREQKAASVNVAGKVDQYAPVSIKGSLTPFDPLQSLDIATSFRQVELTTLTPYSGKFAGYRIRKGRLNLDLHYRIEQGRLNAENKVVLEQLQLGEKVDSPDAVDLPVRLAVALLKDSKGTISIELPVQGNLNDPQFSVMPIVWQTLRNLVVRAAQAPFKFIAGLAGGSDADLSQVGFEPASSELDSEARKRLDTLASALKQRPALRLEVEGMSAAAVDGALLAEQRLQQEFRETQYRILQRRGDKVPADASQIQVEAEDEAALLEGIYRSRLKQQPPAEWRELDDEERAAQMRKAVLDSWRDSAALLRRLSRERAAAIKGYLVDAGLDSERVYLLDTGTTEQGSDGKVATAMHLGSE